MAKPTLLIVGGAWHTADYLVPLSKIFEDAGYPTKTIGLPSVGADPPVTGFSRDVAAVHHAATQLISEGKDIIAALKSLGGISGTEALHGLGKKSSSEAGVKSIVYIAAIVPRKAHCFDDHLEALENVA